MLLSDYLKDNDVFSAINSIETFPFIGTDADVLNTLVTVEYGNKTMVTSLSNLDVETVAKLIVKKYSTRWQSLIKREALLSDNVNDRREVTETVEGTEDRNTTSEGTDKTAAFDSDSLIDSGGNSSTGSDAITNNKTRTMTDEQINVKSSFDLLNVKAKDTIIQSVMSDVSSFLTLSVY